MQKKAIARIAGGSLYLTGCLQDGSSVTGGSVKGKHGIGLPEQNASSAAEPPMRQSDQGGRFRSLRIAVALLNPT